MRSTLLLTLAALVGADLPMPSRAAERSPSPKPAPPPPPIVLTDEERQRITIQTLRARYPAIGWLRGMPASSCDHGWYWPETCDQLPPNTIEIIRPTSYPKEVRRLSKGRTRPVLARRTKLGDELALLLAGEP